MTQAALAQALRSVVQPNLGSKGFKSLLADAVPALDVSSGPKLRPLLELVTRYLFPKPQGWIVEWTGPHGYDVIHDAVKNAKTSLSHDEVSLVVQYLRKSDLFGLAELEKAAGGEGELRNLLFGQTRLGKLMFGEKRYNPEKPLPFEIDDEMQADLAKHFNLAMFRLFNNVRRVTELYSLYWCPGEMTANIAEQIGKKHGVNFKTGRDILQKFGDEPACIDRWIQFPNGMFMTNEWSRKPWEFIPRGFNFPVFVDVVFCFFMRHACPGPGTIYQWAGEETVCEQDVCQKPNIFSSRTKNVVRVIEQTVWLCVIFGCMGLRCTERPCQTIAITRKFY